MACHSPVVRLNSSLKGRESTLRYVTSSWPQAYGEAEVFMKSLAKAVKAARLEGKKWTEELYGFVLAYRTTPHCAMGIGRPQVLCNRHHW